MVLSGGIYVPPMTMAPGQTGAGYRDGNGSDPLGQVAGAAHTQGFQEPADLESLGLTPRQTDVLALLLQAKPNKLIARELGISVETVKDHVAAVLRVLNVSSRTQAVLAVSQMSQMQGGLTIRRKS